MVARGTPEPYTFQTGATRRLSTTGKQCASIPTTPDKFRLLSGEPAIYVKTAESGTKRVQAFCPKCGSPIYAGAFDNPTAPYNIRVGTIRQRDDLVPKRQVWARSRQHWVDHLDEITRIDKQS